MTLCHLLHMAFGDPVFAGRTNDKQQNAQDKHPGADAS